MNSNILGELGLTNNEISIFLALVKKGYLSATQISRETGLNRPYVYYALERLLEKGYLSEVRLKGKKNFKVVEFSQIIASEEGKIQDLRRLFSEAEKLKKTNLEGVDVEVFKGKAAIKNVIKKCMLEMKPKEEMLWMGLDEEKIELLEPIYVEKIVRHFVKNKINERVISKKGGKKLSYAKTTKYRFLEKNLLGNTVKAIYHNTVIEIVYGEPTYVIVIKNKELAETARKQFEVFWKKAS